MPLSFEDWSELIEALREYKLVSGEIKDSTWERVHRHHMKHVLGHGDACPAAEGQAMARGHGKDLGRQTGRPLPADPDAMHHGALLGWAPGEKRLGEEEEVG